MKKIVSFLFLEKNIVFKYKPGEDIVLNFEENARRTLDRYV